MKIFHYEVKCNNCGFEYTITTSDNSEEFINELKDCPCGEEAEVKIEEVEV